MGCSLPGPSVARTWDSLGKNTGVGCHALLLGIFPTQGSNLGLLHRRQILYHLATRKDRSAGPGSIPGLRRSPGEGNGSLLQYSCLENSMDRGAWRTTVHGVTKSQTQLKQLSSSSSCITGGFFII